MIFAVKKKTMGGIDNTRFNKDEWLKIEDNIFFVNKQGKITSQASMFMNRYPWRDTLKLFGAVKGFGAQAF